MVFIVLENNLDAYFKILMNKEYNNKLIIAYFTASWCGPCKTVAPIIQRIGEEKDKIVVLKIDVDECSEISENCEIDCMPTFLFYKNSNIEPIHKFSGADLDLLVKNINNYLVDE